MLLKIVQWGNQFRPLGQSCWDKIHWLIQTSSILQMIYIETPGLNVFSLMELDKREYKKNWTRTPFNLLEFYDWRNTRNTFISVGLGDILFQAKYSIFVENTAFNSWETSIKDHQLKSMHLNRIFFSDILNLACRSNSWKRQNIQFFRWLLLWTEVVFFIVSRLRTITKHDSLFDISS